MRRYEKPLAVPVLWIKLTDRDVGQMFTKKSLVMVETTNRVGFPESCGATLVVDTILAAPNEQWENDKALTSWSGFYCTLHECGYGPKATLIAWCLFYQILPRSETDTTMIINVNVASVEFQQEHITPRSRAVRFYVGKQCSPSSEDEHVSTRSNKTLITQSSTDPHP